MPDTAALPATLALPGGIVIGLERQGDRFLGLGAITVDGLDLRSARLPILPEIRSPDAIELADWRILGQQRLDDGGLCIALEPMRRDSGIMEWMLHRVHNRYRTGDWSAAPRPAVGTRLEIELRPVQRRFRDEQAVGFSYRYRYSSPDIAIYKILDRATWEPGGRMTGCAFWLRTGTAPPIARFTAPGQHYSTEWYLPGIANPSIFQFQPFQTQFNGFTLTAHEQGALVTWIDGVAHVRSLFEKPRERDEMRHLHEHCADLALTQTTRAVEVLWCAGRRDATAAANLWEAVREHIFAVLHAEVGLRQERVQPYAMLEEWGLPDLAAYRRDAVPALLAAGVKQVFLANQFQTNMSVWGLSNMCCTVDHRVGEPERERQLDDLCADLHAGGATVHHWANTALSTVSVIFDRRERDGRQGRIDHLPVEGSAMAELRGQPQAFVRNPAGHIEADHYAPLFCQLNLRDPAVRAYWHRSWRAARERLGFDGIFLDSSFNLSSDKFHWIGQVGADGAGATIDQTALLGRTRPEIEPPAAILSQYHAHLSLMAEMQAYGYHINGEDIGVFGSHRSGPDMVQRLDNLFMWNECLASYAPQALHAAGADPDQVFFDALSHRTMWMLFWNFTVHAVSWRHEGQPAPEDRPTEGQLALLRAFAAAGDDMVGKTILADGRGVSYAGVTRRILWSRRSQVIELAPDAASIDLLTGAVNRGTFTAAAYGVYALPLRAEKE